jgi:hypothetical protein
MPSVHARERRTSLQTNDVPVVDNVCAARGGNCQIWRHRPGPDCKSKLNVRTAVGPSADRPPSPLEKRRTFTRKTRQKKFSTNIVNCDTPCINDYQCTRRFSYYNSDNNYQRTFSRFNSFNTTHNKNAGYVNS